MMPNTDFFLSDVNINSRLVFGNVPKYDIDLSIVIPTYKRIDLLKKNIKAIQKQITSETIVSYEVIIVANDPEFDYRKIECELDPKIFKIYVNDINLGMCGNMNRCAILSYGEYISYIQDDDVLLPNYIQEISKLILSNELNSIDCLIPNRYYLMPNADEKSQFGKKAIRNMGIKRAIGNVLRLGRKVPLFQKITPFETLITTYPFYAGGPTCGMVFKRDSLLASGGFNKDYPYGFDYIFFMEFSKEYNVVLYNKYLSVYMTSESASNRPEVQYDFFRARYYSLEMLAQRYGINDRDRIALHYITYIGYPQETRKMIDKKYDISSINKTSAMLHRIQCMLRTYKSGGYRRRKCPERVREWYTML